MYIILNEVTPYLKDMTLYESNSQRDVEKALFPHNKDEVHITLFDAGGFILYTSKDEQAL